MIDRREQARVLRKEEGLSVGVIAARVGASKSSVSTWVRDIPLYPEAIERLKEAQKTGARRRAELAREVRREAQEQGREFARRGDPLHHAACMLYWAEGSKERNAARVSNSDPAILQIFLRFLRSYFDVRDEMVAVTCTFYAPTPAVASGVEEYWLSQLELPREVLRPSIVNRYPERSYGTKADKLPYGVCVVAIYRTHIVQHIYGAIQEYADCERPEWLG